MIKWIKRHIKIFKVKWVQGQCRHLCCLCKFSNMCYDNLDREYYDN